MTMFPPLSKLGVVSAHPKGFGFVTTANQEEFFIAPGWMRELVPGDTISFELETGKKLGTTQVARPLVVSRPPSVWQGALRYVQGAWVLEPDEACFARIQVAGLQFVADGQLVSVRVPGLESPAGRRGGVVQATLERVLGERGRPGFEVDYALARYDFQTQFSEPALRQSQALVQPVPGAPAPDGRIDLRALPFVTIDGESTRDFDDAVYASQTASGWRVGVAIADVSHYVLPGSALDRDARQQGTSVYLPGRTVPMLPEALSTGVCSLVPGQDRYVVALELALDAQGNIVSSTVGRAVINSAQRLTYADVNQWKAGDLPLAAPVAESLSALWDVYEALAAQRRTRGQMDFDAPEPKTSLDEAGQVQLEWHPRTPAHKLVEELMLLANQCVAGRLQQLTRGLFRHQPAPEPQAWEKLTAWAQTRGVELGDMPSMSAVAALTHDVKEEDVLKAELQARNGMRPATYDSARASHFSLGYLTYTHFTSPIRRYSDLVTHRLLLGASGYDDAMLEDVAQHCSKRSRDGRMAERYVWDKIKKRMLFRDVGPEQVLRSHVVSQSRRGLRVVSAQWQTSALMNADVLLERGFQYDDLQESWARDACGLEPGSMLDVRIVRMEEDKARSELHAVLA